MKPKGGNVECQKKSDVLFFFASRVDLLVSQLCISLVCCNRYLYLPVWCMVDTSIFFLQELSEADVCLFVVVVVVVVVVCDFCSLIKMTAFCLGAMRHVLPDISAVLHNPVSTVTCMTSSYSFGEMCANIVVLFFWRKRTKMGKDNNYSPPWAPSAEQSSLVLTKYMTHDRRLKHPLHYLFSHFLQL